MARQKNTAASVNGIGRTDADLQLRYQQVVKAWQNAETIDDICAATGLTKNQVRGIAQGCRKNGIDLKDLKRSRSKRIDWDAVRLAAE